VIGAKTNPILIEKIREKDIKTILDWFDTKKDIYYKSALIYLKDPQEIEDVFYRVIMKIYEESRRIDKETCFDAWVISILLNECWRRSTNNLEERLNVSDGEILKILSELENNYKDPIILKYIMGLTYDEVSHILQRMPVQTVRSRLFKGIQLLQNDLENSTKRVGCEPYQDKFIDYLDMTLKRDKKIELEIHIRTCVSCNNALVSLQDVFLTLGREVEALEIPLTIMDNLTKRVKEAEQREEKVKKKRTQISGVLASILTIAIFVGFVTHGFSYLYYSWLDWNQLEDEEMLTYLKSGLGEPLNIESESNGIKVKIKTAIADEFRTLIYYEVEDTNEENRKYTINLYEGLTVENEQDVLNLQAEPLSYFPMEEQTVEKKDKNVFSGKLSLLPISEESGTIKLKVSKLLQVLEDPSNPKDSLYKTYTSNNMEFIHGEWSFEIPVTKQASIEHELNKEIEIDGIPIEIDRIAFAPTATMLQYRFNGMDQGNKHIQEINIASLERGKQISQTHNFYSMNSHNGSYQKSFETLYFEKSKEVKIHFSSINYSIVDNVSFNLNAKGKFPQTFEYLGNTISIDNITIGKPTKVVFIDAPPEERVYESLHFEIKTDKENEQLIMNYSSNDGVLIDRHGNTYDPNEYNYYNVKSEPPRYYETKYDIELFEEISGEQVIPNKLQINGYRSTKYLDEVVDIRLD
jgi:DNA-directed RNA polymerase specialized sigma24 family protein